MTDTTTATLPAAIDHREESLLSRFFGLFGDVREGEVATSLLLLTNIFVMLAGYYVCKTVREPLILLSGGAAIKSYASAGQAVLLMAFVPLYGWFASRVDRMRLLLGVSLFFIVNLELFWLAGRAGAPFVGIAFYIWVGIFSTATIAQFWSYGNDLFDKPTAERLFPVIGIGATLGSPLGAAFAERLFARGADPFTLLHVAAGCLGISMLLYWLVERREGARRTQRSEPLTGGDNGFTLLAKSPYLGMICILLLVLNLVNTTGEYILSASVVDAANQLAASTPGFNKGAYIGAFYGNYFFWVNVLAIVLQTFVASRLVRHFGIAGVLFALPLVALGAYGVVAVGAGIVAGAHRQDRGERHRLLDHERRAPAALGADVARGKVQSQAGGRHLHRPAGRRAGRRARLGRDDGAGLDQPRLRVRQSAADRGLARTRLRALPGVPAALDRAARNEIVPSRHETRRRTGIIPPRPHSDPGPRRQAWPVRNPDAHRRGRHGRGLPGQRHAPQSHRRDQGRVADPGGQSRVPRPLRARSAHHLPAQSPQHLHAL